MADAIKAYPLAWPDGWKRTPAVSRVRAQFSRRERQYSQTGGSWTRKRDLSVSDAISRVLAELERLGVDCQDVVSSTNVPTRLDGLPRSGAAAPSDPGAAVYWRTRRDQAPKVMAIDRYDRVADNLAAIAATLEAMRAIERHGGAQILDRVFTGFAALPAPDAAKAWREVLGIPPDVHDLDRVRAAYRTLAQAAHPDRGGSHEQMAEINAAWCQAQEALQ